MPHSILPRTGNNDPGDDVRARSLPASRMTSPEDDNAVGALLVRSLFASRALKTILQRRKREDI